MTIQRGWLNYILSIWRTVYICLVLFFSNIKTWQISLSQNSIYDTTIPFAQYLIRKFVGFWSNFISCKATECFHQNRKILTFFENCCTNKYFLIEGPDYYTRSTIRNLKKVKSRNWATLDMDMLYSFVHWIFTKKYNFSLREEKLPVLNFYHYLFIIYIEWSKSLFTHLPKLCPVPASRRKKLND